MRRELIDQEFVDMKSDTQYKRESALLVKEFASNDRATLRSSDNESGTRGCKKMRTKKLASRAEE
jgi:hypothetical protein